MDQRERGIERERDLNEKEIVRVYGEMLLGYVSANPNETTTQKEKKVQAVLFV